MEEKRTIVLYPSPGIGHLISMVELAKLLHQQSFFNFNITILLTTGLFDHPSIDSYIHRISTSHPSISFLRFPTLTVTHNNHTQSFAATGFQFLKSNSVNVHSTLRQISQSSTTTSLVIDLFCTYAIDSASSLGIPVYYFFTSCASILSLYSYFPQIHRKMTAPTAEEFTASFKDMVGVDIVVPGNVAVDARLMPESLLNREYPAYEEMLYFGENHSNLKGIVVNTFVELEPSPGKF